MPAYPSSSVWNQRIFYRHVRVFKVFSVNSVNLRQSVLVPTASVSGKLSPRCKSRARYYITTIRYTIAHGPQLPGQKDRAEKITASSSAARHSKYSEDVKKLFPSLESPWRQSFDCNHRYWARDILEDYLKLTDLSQREEFWTYSKTEDCGRFLPTILVHLLHSSSSAVSWTPLDNSIFNTARYTLKSRCLTWNDVEDWAFILTAPCADEMAKRLCESSYQVQPFVLLQILNQHLHSVKSLETLFLCMWGLILNKKLTGKESHLQRNNQHLCENIQKTHKMNCKLRTCNLTVPQVDEMDCSDQTLHYPSSDEFYIDLFTFKDLAKKLLKQSCRIWPASMVNVAHMATSFVNMYVARAKCDTQSLDPYTSRQLCYLINSLISSLCNQSAAEPYLLIVYNWSAQKTLLELASKFQPSLVLNQESYRAIIRVLAAHKKTDRQKESTLRRTRSWPPWYVAQHGMDTEETLDEGRSQVLVGISRLREAGYGGDWFEEALSIIGGQEFDGTPTIQTRRMLPSPQKLEGLADLGEMEPNLWAARVIATRDVYEAWIAFKQFKKKGGLPNQEMYLAMFQKLTYDLIKIGRRRNNSVVPGDGLEVLPIADNNYSDYYRRHLEPPCIEDLYSEMLRSGLKPQKRCLSFLIRNSRTPDQAIRYLRASGLGIDILQSLGAFGSLPDCSNIMKVPLSIFSDYIYLICRFVPRMVLVSPISLKNKGRPEWIVVHLKTRSQFGANLDHPLHLAAHLLNTRRPSIHQPWYYFFRVLSRENTIISTEYAGHPRNDILAWKVLRASFDDFSSCGLHLNSRGFIMICHGFEKYIQAVLKFSLEDQSYDVDKAHQFLKAEFKKLSENSCGLYQLPDMYQPIRGVLLHAYMRCLALVKDYEEIILTLEWMARNSSNLKDVLRQESSYSEQKFRRIFIVVAIRFQGTCFEARARKIVDSVEFWYGWPSQDEIEEYRYNSPIEAEIHV